MDNENLQESENLGILAGMTSTPDDKITIDADEEKKELSSDENPYTLSLRRSEFVDSKETRKFIKSVESVVRGIPEYKEWTSYIKDTLGHYYCALTGELSSQVKVDIHHHPVSLYSISKAAIFKQMESQREFYTLDIAQDVINMHYENRIGYVPIVRTLHEKFHNGFLHLPIDMVHGDFRYFIDHYGTFLDEDDLETIQARLAINRDNCGWTGDYNWSQNKYGGDQL